MLTFVPAGRRNDFPFAFLINAVAPERSLVEERRDRLRVESLSGKFLNLRLDLAPLVAPTRIYAHTAPQS